MNGKPLTPEEFSAKRADALSRAPALREHARALRTSSQKLIIKNISVNLAASELAHRLIVLSERLAKTDYPTDL